VLTASIRTLDRRKKDDRLDIEVGAGSTLDVLVEGTGRINFTAELRSERSTGDVLCVGKNILLAKCQV
jgi:hypothetical protein